MRQKTAKGLWMRLAIPFLIFFSAAAVTPAMRAHAASRLQDTGEKLVIVIDPGHGGAQLGTIENDHEEKHMTLVTAQAMYDELVLYDDVEVYLTRTADKKMTLKERAQFAASVDADFLFSIHYNASETHENYGSEVWVSLFDPYNAYGFQAGCEFLDEFQNRGLLVRGVKTKKGDNGDYYGIIRESLELGVPALIVEHCHVDEARDEAYCADDDRLAELGRADATAVAKYFGLKSSRLGVDYSDHELAEVQEGKIVPVTVQDVTEPDICEIEFVSADYEKGILELSVSAADYDSTLLYYSYSLDGGHTFSERQTWPECDTLRGSYPDTFTLRIQIPAGTSPRVIVRAYNMYDYYTESNLYSATQTFQSGRTEEGDGRATAIVPGGEMDETTCVEPSKVEIEKEAEPTEKPVVLPINAPVAAEQEQEKEYSFLSFLELCLVFAGLILVIFIVSQLIARRSKKGRGPHLKKDEGNNDHQLT